MIGGQGSWFPTHFRKERENGWGTVLCAGSLHQLQEAAGGELLVEFGE
jgi:hypothetical protein